MELFDQSSERLEKLVRRAQRSTGPSRFRYEYRILFLSGRWKMPRSRFELRATVLVAADGRAAGVIDWRPLDGAPGGNATEWVRGSMQGCRLEMEGYRVEPGLRCDHYRIVLSGNDQSGVFDGISRAWGAWDGQMDGSYEFRTERI